MSLLKVQIPPGINRDSTEYAAGNSWYDCDNVRFRGGVAESISGWSTDSGYVLDGIGRVSFSSRDYNGNLYQFVGTNWKMYVIVGMKAFDITALGPAETEVNPFGLVANSSFIKVNIPLHGLAINDWINFVSIGTAPLDGGAGRLTDALMTQVRGFQVSELGAGPEALNYFYIQIIDEVTNQPVTSSITTTSDVGGSVVFRERTVAGTNAEVTGAGWGAGIWGGAPDRGWGTSAGSADSVVVDQVRRVYIDNYGEDIMFANSGGPIYYWDTSGNTINGQPGSSGTFGLVDAAIPLGSSEITGSSNTPSTVDSFLISKRDGSCIAFGCNDLGSTATNSLLVRWSDQNNPFDWTPTPTNTSGGQVLRVGNKIIGGISTKDEVLVFTDAALYSMRFVGPPNIFSFSLISQSVEILSHKCAAAAASSVFFMGHDGFYVYTGGGVRRLECPVSKYIFDDINMSQSSKVFSAVDSKFSEIMWFYPSNSGVTDGSFEPNKFVCLNYESNVWTIGTMDMSPLSYTGPMQLSTNNRTSWRDATNTEYPMSSYVYQFDQDTGQDANGRNYPSIEQSLVMMHNFGTSAQGFAIDSYIESGDVELSEGSDLSFYSQIIPDVMMFNSSGKSSATFTVKGKYYPGDASSTQEGSVTANFAAPAVNSDSVVSSYTVGSDVGSDAYVRAMHIRGRARAASIKVSSSNRDAQWRLGDIRIETRPDGRR